MTSLMRKLISVMYMSVILFRCDNVGQRMMLGFGGVLAAGLAIVASFGFCSAVGVAFVSIVGMVPFLVIGMCPVFIIIGHTD